MQQAVFHDEVSGLRAKTITLIVDNDIIYKLSAG